MHHKLYLQGCVTKHYTDHAFSDGVNKDGNLLYWQNIAETEINHTFKFYCNRKCNTLEAAKYINTSLMQPVNLQRKSCCTPENIST